MSSDAEMLISFLIVFVLFFIVAPIIVWLVTRNNLCSGAKTGKCGGCTACDGIQYDAYTGEPYVWKK